MKARERAISGRKRMGWHSQGKGRAQACMLAACMVLAVMSPSRADTPVWSTGGDLTTLAYGSLDPSQTPLLLLSCFNEMEIVVLDVHQEVAGSPGDPITIELSSA